MVKKNREAFALGAVIIPASDGTLTHLGHDVRALGAQALGVVIEDRAAKALVKFPYLSLALWLEHSEMADVSAEAKKGRADFAKLLPDFSDPNKASLCWWLWKIVHDLPVIQVHAFDTGPLQDLWDENEAPLKSYFSGDPLTPAAHINFGLAELILADWEPMQKLLGDRLLFARFLPAGMHRMEFSLYLKY